MIKQLKKLHYLDYSKMIYKCSWYFSKKYNIDFDELLSEANLIYTICIDKYNNKRSKFSTYLYINLQGRISSYCKRKLKRKNTECSISDFQFSHTPDFISSADFENVINQLSNKSKKIIDLISDPPLELYFFCNQNEGSKWQNKINKSVLFKYLKHKNWRKKEINNSFCEIKNLVCDYNNIKS